MYPYPFLGNRSDFFRNLKHKFFFSWWSIVVSKGSFPLWDWYGRIETGLRPKCHMAGPQKWFPLQACIRVKIEHTEPRSSRETSVCSDRCWSEGRSYTTRQHGSRQDTQVGASARLSEVKKESRWDFTPTPH